ncbi:MAG: 16S rRNA (cytidine(1402)-2'-O)-methyltransferase [Pseudobdellovibrio sp.]
MLYLVATPIGDIQEITVRALEILKNADVILCESTKETSKLLKQLDIKAKKYEILNEHSTLDDLKALTELCKTQIVALVSDCGTPGFCDPGNDLINFCRKQNIPVKSILGASSLMGLLSLTSQRLNEFVFRGFLPAENESRDKEWQKLKSEKRAIIIMDTPYRLRKTIDELSKHFIKRKALLALNLSQETEQVLEGYPAYLLQNLNVDKAEFMLMIYPEDKAK